MIKDYADKRIEIGEMIYLVYFVIMFGARAYGLYEGQTAYNIALVIGLLLFAAKMIVTGHSLKEYMVIGGFLLLAGIVYLHTGEKGLLVCFTMMLGMKGVSRSKAVMAGALTGGVIVLCKTFLGVFNIIPEIYYPQERAGVGLMFRHALGYAHPNTMHMNVLVLSIMVMYLVTASQKQMVRSGKKDKRQAFLSAMLVFGLIFLFNLYVFQYTGSRTGILGCVVCIILCIWALVRDNVGLVEKLALYASFPIVCLMSIVLPLVLPEKLFDLLNNTVFHSRYMLSKFFWDGNRISLFGIRLNHTDGLYPTYGLDSAQMYLFLQLGIVAFVVIAVLTVWFISFCIKHNLLPELAVLATMLFVGLWEPLLYNLSFKNFAFVFMGYGLFNALSGAEVAGDEYGDGWNIGITRKNTVVLGAAMLAGIGAMMIFRLVSSEPTALYGNRQQEETGEYLGMEAEYYTMDEIRELRSDGEMVIGYVDDQTPMYRYDSVIAEMEYHKRTLSIGVWSFVITILVIRSSVLLYDVYKRYRRRCQ